MIPFLGLSTEPCKLLDLVKNTFAARHQTFNLEVEETMREYGRVVLNPSLPYPSCYVYTRGFEETERTSQPSVDNQISTQIEEEHENSGNTRHTNICNIFTGISNLILYICVWMW